MVAIRVARALSSGASVATTASVVLTRASLFSAKTKASSVSAPSPRPPNSAPRS
jgi:hypothetical protein